MSWISKTIEGIVGYAKHGPLGVLKSDYTGPLGMPVRNYTSADYRGGMWFFGKDGQDYHFEYTSHGSSLIAYKKCPPVASIVNRKSQAYLNGKTYILDSDGNEAKGKDADKLRKLMERPNPLQSWAQFEAQGYIYRQLFGFSIVYPVLPVGFTDVLDATSLWNIPPFMVDIEETNKVFYQTEQKDMIKKIVLRYKEKRSELPVSDVFIMRDCVPSFESMLFPQPRLASLEYPVNNIIGAFESRNELINYAGSQGMITPEKDQLGTLPFETKDELALQEKFRQQYGIRKGQFRYVIASAALKWQSMGMRTKDLMLFEEVTDDILHLCDGFNYPYRLLSSDKSNSLGGSDVRDFKKLLYQDAIIPEAESDYEQWTRFFQLTERGLKLCKEYSHISVLQADKTQEATARKTLDEALKIEFEAGIITLDQWLEKLGEDPLPNNAGQVRSTDLKNSNVPLAVIIGVGGVQSLIAVITATGLSDDAKQSTLEILFGLKPQDAGRMVSSKPNESTPTNQPVQTEAA